MDKMGRFGNFHVSEREIVKQKEQNTDCVKSCKWDKTRETYENARLVGTTCSKIFMKALYVDSLEVFDVDVAYDILDDMIGESDIGMREYRL